MTMTQACESCGMPIETGRYCAYCTDENGQLQSFEQRFERMTAWQARRSPGTPREEIERQTLDYMATMPAWRDHPRITSRLGFPVPGQPQPTRDIAQLGLEVAYEDLPPEVLTVAKHCLPDWLGVTLAGSQEDAVRLLREMLLEQGGKPVATLLGTSAKTSIQNAAVINSAAAHALDFDDLHVPAHLPNGTIGHPSAPVVAALLALAEATDMDGKTFLAALVSGIEVECRAGLLVAPGHYAAGWHSTATIGTFGAAAACAHALHLSLSQWLNALGLAGVQTLTRVGSC